MTMRVSGMISGLDTESIIEELVKAKSTKVENLTKEKTELEWKQEIWSGLNTKIKSFQNTLSNFRFSSSYKKKTTSVSNSSAVSVITGENAMNGVQELKINSLAKSGYLTGAKLTSSDGEALTASSTLSSLRLTKDSDGNETSGLTTLTSDGGSFTVTANGTATKISVTADTKISEIISSLKGAGVDANFDEKNQRIFIASSSSGTDADFAITADNAEGFTALSVLGINSDLGSSTDTSVNTNAKTLSTYQSLAAFKSQVDGFAKKTVTNDDGESEEVYDSETILAGLDTDSDLYKAIKSEMTTDDDYDDAIKKLAEKVNFADEVLNGTTYTSDMYSSGTVRIAGSDAEIELNGVAFSSSTNSVEVNGLTFTCLATTSDPVTVTTQDDTDGIYDMIKSLFKEYNELINEMDKLYNADSADDYEPLTDDEKEEMTDSEIEKWETTIKDSLLRNDSSLGTVFNSLKTMMLSGYEINGQQFYLSNFGIETLSYYSASDNEHNAYHINGDPDDSNVSSESDKLKSAIATDPDSVISFFTNLSRDLYSKLTSLGAKTDYSSTNSWYDDVQYKTNISDYATKISDAEDALADYEDKYYTKFSNMEVALSKLQSSTSSITSLLG